MGLISSIRGIIQEKQYESTLSKVTKLVETALVHPIGFVKDTKKAYETTSKESLLQKSVGAGANALLVVAPLTGAGKTAIAKTIASATSTIPKAIATGTSLLVGAGALITSKTLRKKTTELASAGPEYAVGTGEKIGQVIEGSKEAGEVSELEWYSTARALGLGAGLSILVAGGVYLGYKLVKGKLQKVEEERTALTPEIPEQGTKKLHETGGLATTIPTNEQKPYTPETTTIKTGRKKRRKGATIKDIPSVNQRVNILINNRSVGAENKRYLKAYAY